MFLHSAAGVQMDACLPRRRYHQKRGPSAQQKDNPLVIIARILSDIPQN